MKRHRIHSKLPVVPIKNLNPMIHSDLHLSEKWLLVKNYTILFRSITNSLDTVISTRIDLAPNPQLDPLLGICCTSFEAEDERKIYQTLIMVDPLRALIEKTKLSNNDNDIDRDKKEIRHKGTVRMVPNGVPGTSVDYEDRISHLHDHVQNCIDEKSLLIKFAKHISKVDPDILICWDENDTLRYIIQRSLVHG